MKSLGEKWNRFWFEPSTADNLGLARILVFGSMAIFYLSTPYLFPAWGWHQTFNEWGGVDSIFWRPIWLFRTLHLPQLGTQATDRDGCGVEAFAGAQRDRAVHTVQQLDFLYSFGLPLWPAE